MKKLLEKLSNVGELTLIDLEKSKAIYGGSEKYDTSDTYDTSESYDSSTAYDSSTSSDS